MKQQKSVIVVGGGIGGLCSAARLCKNGYKVTIVEKQSRVGGRANRITKNGYTFDTGPTLLMMIDTLKDTFAYCSKDMSDYVELTQLEPNYRVTFADLSSITMSSNMSVLARELAKIDENAPEQFYAFFAELAYFYRVARPEFIDKNFDRFRDFINLKSGVKLFRKRGLTKLYSFVSRYFDDERLRQLFSFQSMYLGVSPYEAPAIYSLVSYMETGLGIWYPKGGMYALVIGLEKLVTDMGGTIITDAPVKKILVKDRQAHGVLLDSGKELQSSIVLCNADLTYSVSKLFDSSPKIKRYSSNISKIKHASSALLFYWGVDDSLESLIHHNVYLCSDFKNNLEEIFDEKKLPTEPSFYTYVPTKTDPSLAPKGKHVVYVLVPVPNLEGDEDWEKGIPALRTKVLETISKVYKIDLKGKIETEALYTPQDFQEDYNLTHGSAFGLTHHFMQSGYFRPHNQAEDVAGLYFVGASTYPGGGIPMVALSAKLVVERILANKH